MEINYALALLLVLILNLGSLLTSLANSYCPPPTYPPVPHLPPKHPPHVTPPSHPKPPKKPPPHVKPPHAKPPPHVPTKPPHVKPPIVKPPPYPKPPVAKPPPHPKPPVVKPPPVVVPSPPPTPTPTPVVPVKPPPPTETPCPPPPPKLVPPPPSPPKDTCPIDTLKLGACVDVLGGLIHIGIGSSAKDACCPVLQGLVDLDAAICLCTTIKAKLLNVKLIIPIALQVLIDCGKTPPSGFQCPLCDESWKVRRVKVAILRAKLLSWCENFNPRHKLGSSNSVRRAKASAKTKTFDRFARQTFILSGKDYLAGKIPLV